MHLTCSFLNVPLLILRNDDLTLQITISLPFCAGTESRFEKLIRLSKSGSFQKIRIGFLMEPTDQQGPDQERTMD